MKLHLPAGSPDWLPRFARRIEQAMTEPFTAPIKLQSLTVAELPAAADWPDGLVMVSNEAGGKQPAFSDGLNWRRFSDRAIVS